MNTYLDTHSNKNTIRAKFPTFPCRRGFDDQETVHSPDGRAPSRESEHRRMHGAVARRTAGHSGGGGASAG